MNDRSSSPNVPTPARTPNARRKRRRWPWVLGVVLLLAVGGCWALDEPRPSGEPGAAAEALAREMVAAVDGESWERTGAVRWSFRGERHHLWDRRRQLARIAWDEVEAFVDLTTREGVAFRDGERVGGEEGEELVDEAWKAWINDSFWLNPVVKIFDQGTTRSLVEVENGRGLLVEYASGGATPGDAYLWIVGDDGLPRAWKMWTSNLPLGGVEASWEGWKTLATGARVSTRHALAIGELEMVDVEAAPTLAELVEGEDPFHLLFGVPG